MREMKIEEAVGAINRKEEEARIEVESAMAEAASIVENAAARARLEILDFAVLADKSVEREAAEYEVRAAAIGDELSSEMEAAAAAEIERAGSKIPRAEEFIEKKFLALDWI